MSQSFIFKCKCPYCNNSSYWRHSYCKESSYIIDNGDIKCGECGSCIHLENLKFKCPDHTFDMTPKLKIPFELLEPLKSEIGDRHFFDKVMIAIDERKSKF